MLGGAPVQSVPAGNGDGRSAAQRGRRPAPHDAEPPAGHTTAKATVVDSEYGGRHMDVVVLLGDTRLQARISSGDYGELGPSPRPGRSGRHVVPARDAMVYPADADRTADAEAVGEPTRI